jgi:hypothetical protein
MMTKRDPLNRAVKELENRLEARHGEPMAVAIVVWNAQGRWQLAANCELDAARAVLAKVGGQALNRDATLTAE